ncbi:MAG: sulfotransferase family 2 domain-containing protein [Anaerolineae bacterium]
MKARNKGSTASEPTLVFLHVPKTAGTTLNRIIERQYPTESLYSIGWTEEESVAALRRMSDVRKARICMVRGHMAFGVHEFLPGPVTYFTVLRNPIERVLSYYYFVLSKPDHYLYDEISAGETTLVGFVERQGHIMLDNAQTRMLSGTWFGPAFGRCTREHLATAKQNLREHFAVVGLAERFDETLLLLKRTFGWRNVFYARQNVTRNRPPSSCLPRATLALIAEVNQLDAELYRYAEALFQALVERQGPSFPAELGKFQRTNRLISPFASVLLEARKVSARALARAILDRKFRRKS